MSEQETAIIATTSEQRAIMRALFVRGHYPEDGDGFFWANVDAVSVSIAIADKGFTQRVVWDQLVDSGLHDPTDETDLPCLAADCEAIRSALGNGRSEP